MAVALCLLVLVGAIVLAMRKRHEATRNSNSYSSSGSSGDRHREGYTSLDTVERDHNNSTTNASWL